MKHCKNCNSRYGGQLCDHCTICSNCYKNMNAFDIYKLFKKFKNSSRKQQMCFTCLTDKKVRSKQRRCETCNRAISRKT